MSACRGNISVLSYGREKSFAKRWGGDADRIPVDYHGDRLAVGALFEVSEDPALRVKEEAAPRLEAVLVPLMTGASQRFEPGHRSSRDN